MKSIIFVPYGGGSYYDQAGFQRRIKQSQTPWINFAGSYSILLQSDYSWLMEKKEKEIRPRLYHEKILY